MTLIQHLQRRITANGPLSMAEFMAEALLHPEHGYYTTRDPLGRSGDFVTAPEISQMFGELIGLSLAQSWLDQGAPEAFTLVEFGPGRGTLMADALRATRQVPGFHAAAELTLLEASPVLRAAQATTLKDPDPRWIDNPDSLPDQPLFAIANEFFDALPIRQFVREGSKWCERAVGWTEKEGLHFGLSPAQPQPALHHRLEDTRDGDLIEDCPAAAPMIASLSHRIATHGGAALLID